MATIKYPGELGKPIPWREGLAAAIKYRRDDKAWDTWFLEKRVDVLFKLLDHFQIKGIKATNPKSRWFWLAYHLAEKHVPAFQLAPSKGPGRPRTRRPQTTNALAEILGVLPKKKGGRPRIWSLLNYHCLLADREEGADLLRRKGERITDQAAMLEFYRHWNRGMTKLERRGMSDYRLRELANKDAKRLPDARKVIREPPEN